MTESVPLDLVRKQTRKVKTFRKVKNSRKLRMEDKTLLKGSIILSVTFLAGFFCGYEFYQFRMEWLKRRRERLARKLQETQKQIDIMSTQR